MRKFFRSVVFLLNLFAALVLGVSFVLPYLPPSRFPVVSILSLAVPVLIIVNILFVIYWVFLFNRRFILSALVLVISFIHFNGVFQVSSEGNPAEYKNTLSILSYNVRLFNAYEKKSHDDVKAIFSEIVSKTNSDIIFIQEYSKKHKIDFSKYPHQHVHFKNNRANLGHAIFSKFPIINKGAFDFKGSGNNVLYADIVKDKDTIRVYNLHLQSFGIIPDIQFLQESDKEKLLRRVSSNFKKQESQVYSVLSHKSKSKYPVILCGDFNNTPFSYTYRKLNEGMQDAFKVRGNGLGTTFWFDGFPLRIDYILASPKFNILSFETFSKTFSDHNAIHTTVGW